MLVKQRWMEWLYSLEQSHEDILLGLAIKEHFVHVEIFVQVTTASTDSNVRMPILDRFNERRNSGTFQAFIAIAIRQWCHYRHLDDGGLFHFWVSLVNRRNVSLSTAGFGNCLRPVYLMAIGLTIACTAPVMREGPSVNRNSQA